MFPKFFADVFREMSADELIELELMLNRFNRLITELRRGAIVRTTFQPWEVDILLDIESCQLQPKRKREVLQQYQRAVGKQLEMGPGPPMKLSEFLQSKITRRPSIDQLPESTIRIASE